MCLLAVLAVVACCAVSLCLLRQLPLVAALVVLACCADLLFEIFRLFIKFAILGWIWIELALLNTFVNCDFHSFLVLVCF